METENPVYKEALNKAVRFIQYRPRSEKEVLEKLRRLEYSPSIIKQVISELINNGLLDDALFALLFARERAQNKLLGKNRVKMELKQKGIAEEWITEALEDSFPEGAALGSAIALLEKKFRSGIKKEEEKKAADFLVRKGYSWSDASQAVKSIQNRSSSK